MASERGVRLGVLAGAAALAGLGACAASVTDSPRLLVLCGLGGAAVALAMWHWLRRLRLPVARPETPPAPAAWPAQEAVLALEARLEHAPIALFRIDGLSGPGAVAPVNANARRLVAPGRASDPGTLYALLADQPADERRLVGFDTERGLERAMVAVSTLAVKGQGQRLAALMPVESQLEAEALNAWRQLVHVLTHEIMNSLTPVASLSRTAHELLDELAADLPADAADDLSTALDAIARRAASLADFVSSYRSLSTLPQAQPERVHLEGLFARLSALVGPAWQARGGTAEFSVETSSLEVMADPGQLEQALINLLKNAA
jgi:signal transduction histidine kinase